MTVETALSLMVFVLGLIFGLRGSVRLTRRLRGAWAFMEWRERLLLTAIVIVAWVVIVFALYVGGMSLRRALGFESLSWAPFVGAVFAAAVLFVPTFLDVVVDRVASVREP